MYNRLRMAAVLPFVFLLVGAHSLADDSESEAGQRVMLARWVVEFKTGSDVVARGRLGEILEASKSKGDWLWINSKRGWIKKSDAVPVEKAADHFTLLLGQNRTFDAYFQRGVVWVALGKDQEAVKDFDLALAKDPQNVAVRNERGIAQRRLGNYDRAIEDFGEVIRQNAGHPTVFTNRGLAWHDKGDYSKALADFNAAIDLDPNFAPAWEAGGSARQAMQQFIKASANYREAIRLNPNFEMAHNNLAWLLATCPEEMQRDGVQAVQHATRACELTRFKDAGYLDTLAAALAEAGKFDEAVSRAKEAIALADDAAKPAISDRLKNYEAHQTFHESSN